MTTALNETEQGQDRFQRAWAARRAAIETRLDEMETVYRDAIRVELNQIVEQFGWPTGHTQGAYLIRWTEGVDAHGIVHWGEAYATDPDPDERGFYLTMTRKGLLSLRIVAPTVVTTFEWWRGIVTRRRELRIYELNDQGESINWHPRTVTDVAMVPCAGLRQELGLSGDRVPPDEASDHDQEWYGAKLVSVGMKTDGTFVPWAPPVRDGAS